MPERKKIYKPGSSEQLTALEDTDKFPVDNGNGELAYIEKSNLSSEIIGSSIDTVNRTLNDTNDYPVLKWNDLTDILRFGDTDGNVNGTEIQIDDTNGRIYFLANGVRMPVSTSDVSNPPTDAELDALFGTPTAVGNGFTSFINDNGAGTNFYKVTSDGTNWWIFTGTKAV